MTIEIFKLIYFTASVALSVFGFVTIIDDRKNTSKAYYCMMCLFAALSGMCSSIYLLEINTFKSEVLLNINLSFMFMAFASFILLMMHHCVIYNMSITMETIGKIIIVVGLTISILFFYNGLTGGTSPIFSKVYDIINLSEKCFFAMLKYVYSIILAIYLFFLGHYVSERMQNERFRITYSMVMKLVFAIVISNTVLMFSSMFFPLGIDSSGIAIISMLVLAAGIFYIDKLYAFFDKSPKRFMDGIVNNMQDGILIYNEKFEIVYVNDSLSDMMNLPKSELLYEDMSTLFAYAQSTDSFLKEAFFEERTIHYDSLNKAPLPIILSILPHYDSSGEFIGGVSTIQDATMISAERADTEKKNTELKMEIEKATKKIVAMTQQIEKEIEKKSNVEKIIEEHLTKDLLTGLNNRDTIMRNLQDLLSTGTNNSLAVILFDIDDFRPINDIRGHKFGDKLLIEVANRIKLFESEDISLARLEEDEFMLIYNSFSSLNSVIKLCENLMMYIGMPLIVEGVSMNITVSIGVALYPEHGTTADTLYKNADATMYFAKNEGKNRFVFFNKSFQEKTERDFTIMNELSYSLIRDEMSMTFLPRITFELNGENRITSLETVLSWNNRSYGLMHTNTFIDIAVRGGFISELDNFMLINAEKFITSSLIENGTVSPVSVKISPKTFFRGEFAEKMHVVLRRNENVADYLVIEVSESTIMKDINEAQKILSQVVGLGYKVILSDFGMEMSSMNFLKNFDIYAIKIDEFFTSEIGVSVKSEAIIKTVISLGRLLNIKVVAEGVNTERQFNFLREIGCKTFQGYHICPPLKEQQVYEELMKERERVFFE